MKKHIYIGILVFSIRLLIAPDALAQTYIFDDLHEEFQTTGAWQENRDSSQCHALTDQRTESSLVETARATWILNLPESAAYSVSVWYSDGVNSVSDARYIINHAGGADLINLNQQTHGGMWISLGSFSFDATPAAGSIVLSNQSSSEGQTVVADAIRLVREGTTYDRSYQAMWLSSWSAGFLSQWQTNTMIQMARTNHVNALFPEVRKTGDAYYLSSIEPRASNMNSSYLDPLADIINQAHDTSEGKQSMEVHAWLVPYRVWSGSDLSKLPSGHILRKHPDWVTRDYSGMDSTEVLDPGVPAVQDYLVEVILEIAENYDVEGIHFDYIRYFGNQYGYHPKSVARFNRLYERSGTPEPNDPEWSDFRREQILTLTRRVYARVKQVRWNIKMSAATITWLPAPPEGDFTQTRPYDEVLQDWPKMLAEGSLDLNCPMNYMRDHDPEQKEGFRQWTAFTASVRAGRHAIIGPGSYLNTIPNNITQMNYARDFPGIDGNILYRYGASCSEREEDESWRTIRSDVFDERRDIPEAEWLTDPSFGILCGVVRDPEGFAVDGAEVTLSEEGLEPIISDGSGFYAFLKLPVGPGSATASFGEAQNTELYTISAGTVTTLDIILDLPTATPTPTPEERPSWTPTPTPHETPVGTPIPTATPLLNPTPTFIPGSEILIDDDDILEGQVPGWTETGFGKSTWGSGYYDGEKHFSDLAYPPDSYFTWSFGNLPAGDYQIYVWTQGAQMDKQADYEILSDEGNSHLTRSVSQWYEIGENGWRQVAGPNDRVYLSGLTTITLDNSSVNAGGAGSCYADACKVVGPYVSSETWHLIRTY